MRRPFPRDVGVTRIWTSSTTPASISDCMSVRLPHSQRSLPGCALSSWIVATASPLIRGRALLGEAAWTRWHEVFVETVGRTATREGPHVNWRPELFAPPGRTPAPIVQFCHGAPGFVVCLGDLPGDELDELLLGAGETTWAAGPLAKGPGLWHGTAGNGYAFLKLHRRTGDARWLARAHAFAMHAIAQSERDGPRASLWTGDLGVALYLRACLDGDARFPTLDVFYA